MARHIDAKETAKIIRAELKKEFPKDKFSVRIHRYSMGASVNINYSNGSSLKAVNRVLSQFKGKTFDGMTDMSEYHNTTWKGEEVCFGQYINCDRDVSNDFVQRVYDYCLNRFGKQAENLKIGGNDNCAVFDVDDYCENDWLLREANQILRESDYDRVFDWELEKKQQEEYENKLVISQREQDNSYLDGLEKPQEYQQYVGFENDDNALKDIKKYATGKDPYAHDSVVVNLADYKKPETATATLPELYKTWLNNLINSDRLSEVVSYEDWRKTYGQAQLEQQYASFVHQCLAEKRYQDIDKLDNWIVQHF